MKNIICFLALSFGLLSPAQAITITYDFSGLGLALPDGDPTGVANLQNIVTPITSITDISVSLHISGTCNGDIYATLQHDSGFAVLLNRIGRSSLEQVVIAFQRHFRPARMDGVVDPETAQVLFQVLDAATREA